jgi:hypothetical protein
MSHMTLIFIKYNHMRDVVKFILLLNNLFGNGSSPFQPIS